LLPLVLPLNWEQFLMRNFVAFTLLFLGLCPLAAQTSYPMISHSIPVAVQRGTSAEVTVEGKMNFFGASKVFVEGTGVTAEVVDKAPPRPAGSPVPQVGKVKLRVTAAPDALPGVREFRIITAVGPSSVGQLLICDEPVVLEKGDNNTLAKAPRVPVPAMISGRIEAAEDVDFYQFRAEAGQTFTFEVHCARLQDKIHDLQKHADPMIKLYDAQGRELADSDDFFFADPALTYTFQQAGDYSVEVRDSKYDGDPRWVYALRITTAPHASHVFPMAGNPGQTVAVEPIGSAARVKAKTTVATPTIPGLHWLPVDLEGQKTHPVPFLVSELRQELEQEPNDEPEKATRITIPCGINGRISQPRDLDHYVFTAAKGKVLRFEVKARRFGTPYVSALDSVVDILDKAGRVLLSTDDTPGYGKDAVFTWTAPADGDYLLRVRDLNSNGGPTAIYHIEADWALPDFTLRCDPDKAMIGPGSRACWFVHVARVNGFTGPVTVEVKGLPAGVTASPLTIPPAMTQGVVVLSAAEDAVQGGTLVEVVGTSVAQIDGKPTTLTRVAQPIQEIYAPGGGRARFDVNTQVVAVTEPSDILKVLVSPEKVTLKPGEEVKLDVTIERRPGYTGGVSLDIPLRHLNAVFGNPLPPGVTIVDGKSKTLLGQGNKGHITLKAAPGTAEIETPICVMAHVSINFVVKVSYSSPMIPLAVQK
jgi:hypothetical protein